MLWALILAYNEEANLPVCLNSLKALHCNTVVIDSGSTDRTVAVARELGARVLFHKFVTHATQWQWALEQLPMSVDWVLALDADQRLSGQLCVELSELLRPGNTEATTKYGGFYLRRKQIFRGRWIKHGGYYPKYLLKLFRRRAVKVDTREQLDHHFYVDGTVGLIRGDLIEENQKEDEISFWIDKHNRYAGLLAAEEFQRVTDQESPFLHPRLFGTPDERTLWLKKVWRCLPPYGRGCMYFVYRYFFRLGFLDGKEGFLFHFLQAFWFRVIIDAKLDEFKRASAPRAGDASGR